MNNQKHWVTPLNPSRQHKQYPQIKANTNVTLSDLNPQDKLKIGQLITANENYKNNILQLNQQLTSYQRELEQARAQILELRQSRQALSSHLDQTLAQLNLSKQEQANQLQNISHLTNQVKILQNTKVSPPMDVVIAPPKSNISSQTENKVYESYGIQTKCRKMVNKSIQTEEEGEEMSIQYRDIVKDLIQVQEKRRGQTSPDDLQLESLVHSQWREEDVDNCFSDLAQKWLQVKENNMKQLVKSYRSSRSKNKKKAGSTTTSKDRFVTQSQEPPEIDQNQLNKLLKSRTFSASRLLNPKTTQQLSNPSQQIQPMPLKLPQDPVNNSKPVKIAAMKEKVQGQLPDDDHDLMDLVNSLT